VLLDLNADWSVATTYFNGPGIDNHLRQTSATTGVSYFLNDHLGSTAALTNVNGNPVEQENYDSFGNSASSARTRYGYTGRERDPDTGMLYYRARFYDPQVGRFLSEDPMGFYAAVNWYAYVGDDPISYIDSTGMEILTAKQYEQPILLPPDEQERKRLAAFLDCVERNRFSSLFGGVPYVHGGVEFLEIGGPVSLMSDLAATGAKLAGKTAGDPQPYASGINAVFRAGTRAAGYPKIGGTPVRGVLTGIGNKVTPALAVTGTFTFAYNATIEVECGCGVIK
jgi:RHS repeat-associated protein